MLWAESWTYKEDLLQGSTASSGIPCHLSLSCPHEPRLGSAGLSREDGLLSIVSPLLRELGIKLSSKLVYRELIAVRVLTSIL